MNRRRFLKYAGATAAVVGASTLGLDYLLRPKLNSQQTSTSTIISLAPPTITNFKWQPTKIVNGKVYDATISFDVESAEPATSLSGILKPYAPTIPARAYPAEDPITLRFTTSPQSSDVTTYSANVANLKGGKQYALNAQAVNAAGTQTANFETPYVREFEKALNSELTIGAYYYPWYTPSKFASNPEPAKGTPLLGYYDSQDQMIQSKHIDWSTGHGISFWLSSWFGPKDDRAAAIFQNPLSSDIKMGILYESLGLLSVTQSTQDDIYGANWLIDLDDKNNSDLVVGHVNFLAENYFGNPQYLRIDEKPVLFLYVSSVYAGNIEHVFGLMRDAAQNQGYGLFLFGDEMFWQSEASLGRLKLYDAVTAYLMPTHGPTGVTIDNYSSRLDGAFDTWSRKAAAAGTGFVPVVSPGFHSVKETRAIVRDPQEFGERFETAKKHLDGRLKMLMVTSFNEWYEDTYVEPSLGDGFKYLQIIRHTLSGT